MNSFISSSFRSVREFISLSVTLYGLTFIRTPFFNKHYSNSI